MDAQKIILGILVLQALIVIHEYGHYWFAKRFGMRVSRFSIGFGPKLFGFKRQETEFVLSLAPLGGYVQIDGMSPQDDIDPKDPAAYPNKPMWQRFIVVLMGPVFNLVLAFFCFWAMFGLGFDRPVFDKAVIGNVRPGQAAEKAGQQKGDLITKIGGTPVATFEDVPAAVQSGEGEIDVVVMRGGSELTVRVNPDVQVSSSVVRKIFRLDQKSSRALGIESPTEHVSGVGFFTALTEGAKYTLDRTAGTLEAFGTLITGRAKGRLTGLPGIVKLLGGSIDRGLSAVLSLMAILSINLFLFNLFPLPALDGGRLIFLGLEGVRRKPVDVKLEAVVHTLGFVLLLGLILFVSVRDLIV
jgi:regulator of sigma E protease